ncbi:MAG: DoxX family protein [Sedimentitalea sp.]|uniref:DoxX family protein n=1 Tax=Sedimentitalea sp. TaxID=2048915 RepID=UPI0032672387
MSPDTNYSALIMRLSLGAVLLAHGMLKLLVFTVPGTVGYFASLGLPPIAAHLTIYGEILGGTALLIGVYARLVALAALPLLLGTVWVHSANGWLFSSEGGGWEFPLLLVVMAIAVVAQGAGPFAVKRFQVLDSTMPPFFRA